MLERPSDYLDAAADLTELERVSRIAEHLARTAAKALQPKGACHFCDEPVETGEIFCDEYCAEDHEYIEKRKAANGRT